MHVEVKLDICIIYARPEAIIVVRSRKSGKAMIAAFWLDRLPAFLLYDTPGSQNVAKDGVTTGRSALWPGCDECLSAVQIIVPYSKE